MSFLSHIHVLNLAVNVPGPVAGAMLRDMGAHVTKIEPLSGDPLAALSPDWYAELVRDLEVVRVDLKDGVQRSSLEPRLATADLLITATRPAALERLGLDWPGLHAQASTPVSGRDRRVSRAAAGCRRPRPHVSSGRRASLAAGNAAHAHLGSCGRPAGGHRGARPHRRAKPHGRGGARRGVAVGERPVLRRASLPRYHRARCHPRRPPPVLQSVSRARGMGRGRGSGAALRHAARAAYGHQRQRQERAGLRVPGAHRDRMAGLGRAARPANRRRERVVGRGFSPRS